ncbi:MAG: PrsW family glutamic-type intramembrane protease [Nitrospiraceae bacterium]
MDQGQVSESELFLVCISGPDQGKRLAVRHLEVTLGRSNHSNVLSDDLDVASRHVSFMLKQGQPCFRALDGNPVFVDGHLITEGMVAAKQQLRIGRSLWQVLQDESAEGIVGWIDSLGGHISTVAGVERIQGFSLRDMFSEVFRKRKDEDVEEYFLAGTSSTTPRLGDIDINWPKPWVFAQVFGLSLVVYLGFVFALEEFLNVKLVPGLIVTGSFLIPFSLLIFFFEMNVARNVSLYQVIKMVFVGGILSLILSLFLFEKTNLAGWMGAASAGIIEETGKAATLLLVLNKVKYRWTLNGLLFGAAVGTGFASFESAGYALEEGLKYARQGGTIMIEPLLQSIKLRGVLSVVGGHVLWTGLVGAALWTVRGEGRFTGDMLKDPRFIRIFLLAMVLHMSWNAPIFAVGNAFYFKAIVLGFVSWIVILGFIQAGLKQIRAAQQEGSELRVA